MFITRVLLNTSFAARAIPEQAALLNVTLIGNISKAAESRPAIYADGGKSVVFHLTTESPNVKSGNTYKVDHRIAVYKPDLVQCAEKFRENDVVMMKGRVVGHKKEEISAGEVKVYTANTIIADTIVPIMSSTGVSSTDSDDEDD